MYPITRVTYPLIYENNCMWWVLDKGLIQSGQQDPGVQVAKVGSATTTDGIAVLAQSSPVYSQKAILFSSVHPSIV